MFNKTLHLISMGLSYLSSHRNRILWMCNYNSHKLIDTDFHYAPSLTHDSSHFVVALYTFRFDVV